jgi:hypothetical protein
VSAQEDRRRPRRVDAAQLGPAAVTAPAEIDEARR